MEMQKKESMSLLCRLCYIIVLDDLWIYCLITHLEPLANVLYWLIFFSCFVTLQQPADVVCKNILQAVFHFLSTSRS